MSAAYYAKVIAEGRLGVQKQESLEVDMAELEDGFDAADVFGDLAGNLSPTRGSGNGAASRSGGKYGPDLEVRSQKTAAAVDQMRDRLHAMGILQAAGPQISAAVATSSDLPDSVSSPVRNVDVRALKRAAEANQLKDTSLDDAPVIFPPPPPYIATANAGEENKRRTAAAVDSMRENLRDMGLLHEDKMDASGEADDDATESTESGGEEDNDEFDEETQTELAEKAKHCNKLLA